MFAKLINNLTKAFQVYKLYNNKKLVESFSVYYPDLQNHYVYPANTFTSANNSIKILSEIACTKNPVEPFKAEEFLPEARKDADDSLKDLFNKYGSDKSSYHNYDLIYVSVLSILMKNKKEITLFEIGLGTNNVSVPSNMGVNGKPGASLRAFRDFLPTSQIFGADIDRNILFQDERISTTYLDQTVYSTYLQLNSSFGVSTYDLIIDDGLHSPEANLNTLKFALQYLSTDGWLIIEDIPERSLPVWQTTLVLLKNEYSCWIVNCKGFYLFVVYKGKLADNKAEQSNTVF